MTNSWISWNENISHPYKKHFTPSTEEEIRKIVQESETIRVYGTKCSSADIAAGTETLLSFTNYKSILSYDENKREITVQTGITLAELLTAIEAKGWCVPCLPDIDTITLGGALATGTHGTAKEGHPISQYMVSCRIITADGTIEVWDCTKGDEFEALRVSIGLLGIMSTVTLSCEPLYNMRLSERPMKDTQWLQKYRELLDSTDFLRILWMPHTNKGYVITGEKVSEDEHIEKKNGPWFHKYRRPVSKFLYNFTTKFPRFSILANRIIATLFFSAKIEKSGTLYGASVTKSRGSTLELAEWTIALDRFDELFVDLKAQLDSLDNQAFVHIPMDIRFIRADKSWLSYGYNQDTVTIGCVSRNAKAADSYEAFTLVEQIFLKHGGRPHWAKRFKAGKRELSQLYPKWDDFIALRRKMDPTGKFLNAYLGNIFR